MLIGAGSLLRCTITASSGWAVLIPGLIVTGIGVGLASPVLVSATLAAVRPERAGMASGSVNTFRQLGYALGIAALGTIFTTRLGDSLARSGSFADAHAAAATASQGGAGALIAHAQAGARAGVAHAIRAAYASGQNDIYLIAGLAAILGGLLVLALVRPAPAPAAAVAPATG